jgi:hypothetical protein
LRRLAVWEKHDSCINRVEDPTAKASGRNRVKEYAPLESSDVTANITWQSLCTIPLRYLSQ